MWSCIYACELSFRNIRYLQCCVHDWSITLEAEWTWVVSALSWLTSKNAFSFSKRRPHVPTMPAEYSWNLCTGFLRLGCSVAANTKFTARKMWVPVYQGRYVKHKLFVCGVTVMQNHCKPWWCPVQSLYKAHTAAQAIEVHLMDTPTHNDHLGAVIVLFSFLISHSLH